MDCSSGIIRTLTLKPHVRYVLNDGDIITFGNVSAHYKTSLVDANTPDPETIYSVPESPEKEETSGNAVFESSVSNAHDVSRAESDPDIFGEKSIDYEKQNVEGSEAKDIKKIVEEIYEMDTLDFDDEDFLISLKEQEKYSKITQVKEENLSENQNVSIYDIATQSFDDKLKELEMKSNYLKSENNHQVTPFKTVDESTYGIMVQNAVSEHSVTDEGNGNTSNPKSDDMFRSPDTKNVSRSELETVESLRAPENKYVPKVENSVSEPLNEDLFIPASQNVDMFETSVEEKCKPSTCKEEYDPFTESGDESLCELATQQYSKSIMIQKKNKDEDDFLVRGKEFNEILVPASQQIVENVKVDIENAVVNKIEETLSSTLSSSVVDVLNDSNNQSFSKNMNSFPADNKNESEFVKGNSLPNLNISNDFYEAATQPVILVESTATLKNNLGQIVAVDSSNVNIEFHKPEPKLEDVKMVAVNFDFYNADTQQICQNVPVTAVSSDLMLDDKVHTDPNQSTLVSRTTGIDTNFKIPENVNYQLPTQPLSKTVYLYELPTQPVFIANVNLNHQVHAKELNYSQGFYEAETQKFNSDVAPTFSTKSVGNVDESEGTNNLDRSANLYEADTELIPHNAQFESINSNNTQKGATLDNMSEKSKMVANNTFSEGFYEAETQIPYENVVANSMADQPAIKTCEAPIPSVNLNDNGSHEITFSELPTQPVPADSLDKIESRGELPISEVVYAENIKVSDVSFSQGFYEADTQKLDNNETEKITFSKQLTPSATNIGDDIENNNESAVRQDSQLESSKVADASFTQGFYEATTQLCNNNSLQIQTSNDHPTAGDIESVDINDSKILENISNKGISEKNENKLNDSTVFYEAATQPVDSSKSITLLHHEVVISVEDGENKIPSPALRNEGEMIETSHETKVTKETESSLNGGGAGSEKDANKKLKDTAGMSISCTNLYEVLTQNAPVQGSTDLLESKNYPIKYKSKETLNEEAKELMDILLGEDDAKKEEKDKLEQNNKFALKGSDKIVLHAEQNNHNVNVHYVESSVVSKQDISKTSERIKKSDLEDIAEESSQESIIKFKKKGINIFPPDSQDISNIEEFSQESVIKFKKKDINVFPPDTQDLNINSLEESSQESVIKLKKKDINIFPTDTQDLTENNSEKAPENILGASNYEKYKNLQENNEDSPVEDTPIVVGKSDEMVTNLNNMECDDTAPVSKKPPLEFNFENIFANINTTIVNTQQTPKTVKSDIQDSSKSVRKSQRKKPTNKKETPFLEEPDSERALKEETNGITEVPHSVPSDSVNLDSKAENATSGTSQNSQSTPRKSQRKKPTIKQAKPLLEELDSERALKEEANAVTEVPHQSVPSDSGNLDSKAENTTSGTNPNSQSTPKKSQSKKPTNKQETPLLEEPDSERALKEEANAVTEVSHQSVPTESGNLDSKAENTTSGTSQNSQSSARKCLPKRQTSKRVTQLVKKADQIEESLKEETDSTSMIVSSEPTSSNSKDLLDFNLVSNIESNVNQNLEVNHLSTPQINLQSALSAEGETNYFEESTKINTANIQDSQKTFRKSQRKNQSNKRDAQPLEKCANNGMNLTNDNSSNTKLDPESAVSDNVNTEESKSLRKTRRGRPRKGMPNECDENHVSLVNTKGCNTASTGSLPSASCDSMLIDTAEGDGAVESNDASGSNDPSTFVSRGNITLHSQEVLEELEEQFQLIAGTMSPSKLSEVADSEDENVPDDPDTPKIRRSERKRNAEVLYKPLTVKDETPDIEVKKKRNATNNSSKSVDSKETIKAEVICDEEEKIEPTPLKTTRSVKKFKKAAPKLSLSPTKSVEKKADNCDQVKPSSSGVKRESYDSCEDSQNSSSFFGNPESNQFGRGKRKRVKISFDGFVMEEDLKKYRKKSTESPTPSVESVPSKSKASVDENNKKSKKKGDKTNGTQAEPVPLTHSVSIVLHDINKPSSQSQPSAKRALDYNMVDDNDDDDLILPTVKTKSISLRLNKTKSKPSTSKSDDKNKNCPENLNKTQSFSFSDKLDDLFNIYGPADIVKLSPRLAKKKSKALEHEESQDSVKNNDESSAKNENTSTQKVAKREISKKDNDKNSEVIINTGCPTVHAPKHKISESSTDTPNKKRLKSKTSHSQTEQPSEKFESGSVVTRTSNRKRPSDSSNKPVNIKGDISVTSDSPSTSFAIPNKPAGPKGNSSKKAKNVKETIVMPNKETSKREGKVSAKKIIKKSSVEKNGLNPVLSSPSTSDYDDYIMSQEFSIHEKPVRKKSSVTEEFKQPQLAIRRSSRSKNNEKKTDEKKAEKVMFTGLSDKKFSTIVTNLGGTVVDSPFTCTVLVTDSVKRTTKFLCALSRGLPIVTPEWLHASSKAGSFSEYAKYIVSDKAAEKAFSFNLKESLKKAASKKILDGWSVFVTPSVKPPPEEMKSIIECSGGKYLKRKPERWTCTTFVISCQEDEGQWTSLTKKGKPPVIVGTEAIFSGILQQNLDIENYRLH